MADDQATPCTLWSDADRTTQYLIPDGLVLPSGDFLLRTATGRERRTDPKSLTPFQVTEDEAVAWAKSQLGATVRRLGEGLREAILGSPARTDPQDGTAPGGQDGAAPSPTPGMDLLADITGTPRERLSGNYRAVGQALGDYLKDLTATAGDALSGDPQREREARLRMRAWAETLRAHGIAAAEVEDPDAPPTDGPGPQDPDRQAN